VVATENALILDFDGTLIDSEAAFIDVWRGLLAEHGVSIEVADLAPFVGASGSRIQAQWEKQLQIWLGAHIDAAALDAEGDRRIEAVRLALPLLPGALELLAAAQTMSWRIGLATGSYREQVERHLQRLAILDRFDTIVTTHDVERPKPAPDIYFETANRLQVSSNRCVAIEDSPRGCAAALAASMTVVICPCRVTQHFDFPAGAHRVSSLADINLGSLRP
jgi:putative hydrolase of the HAD superfamily